MHYGLAALLFFGILTLWVPEYWATAVFQVGVFLLAPVAVWRARKRPAPFCWMLVPLTSAVIYGCFQLFTGRTAYVYETRLAVLRWAAFLAVFVIGRSAFRDESKHRWFRSAVLYFASLLAVIATLQTFTSHGKVFWLFPTPYTDNVMGPILNRNAWANFIEAVLPIALWGAIRERNSLLYSGMAAAMYASVIACASRTGTLLTTLEVIAVPVLVFLNDRGSLRAKLGAPLLRIAMAVAAFTLVAGWDTVWQRLWSPDPGDMRKELTLSSIQMLRTHLWFGTGLGTWPTVYPQFALIDPGAIANQAHDDWLQLAVEGGLPFGILMFTMFVWSLGPALRSIWGIGVIAVFLHAFVDYPFSRPPLGSWTFAVLALIATVPKVQRAHLRRRDANSASYSQDSLVAEPVKTAFTASQKS